ncbi:MAG: malonic semialdehyde reductase [Rhodospirillales bacterium]|nr:MAG: malonic semialdehyde reductase [Rhodospirillales bacterium]
MVAAVIPEEALGALFRDARTHFSWRPESVSEDVLRAAWDLAKMGPTSANCSPARITFATSREAKERLKPCLIEGNVEKTMTAPVTAIIGYDLAFHERLPELYKAADARAWFEGNEGLIQSTAFRNGSLQGAYFIIAARAMGLDCGPMSGFDNAKVDAAFFADTTIRSNFLCNLGHGDGARVRPRDWRLPFDEACQIV